MPNPFEELRRQHQLHKFEEQGWEEVDGPMTCQTKGCYGVAQEGKYHAELRVVTWKCPSGHISRLDNFVA